MEGGTEEEEQDRQRKETERNRLESRAKSSVAPAKECNYPHAHDAGLSASR